MLSEKEPKTDETLVNLSKIVYKDFGLIKEIRRVHQYYDEPKFWYYSAVVNDNFSKSEGKHFHTITSGISITSEKLAILKCLCEAIERYCNLTFVKTSTSAIGSIKSIKGEFIDPRLFARFSKNQLQDTTYKRFRITENSRFRWTNCISLNTESIVKIPSQFIYLAYPYLKKEPSIYPAISTGVAGGSCVSAALVRGIYEIIERDAFMIYYLNKLPAVKIILNKVKNEEVSKINEIAKRYKLKIIPLDITTDLDIPVIATIVVNRVGIGKAISVGLKSNLNPVRALVGSVEEALHTRTWLRREYEKKPVKVNSSSLLKKSGIKARGMLWYPTSMISKLDFWINSPKTKTIVAKNSKIPSGNQLKNLITILNKNGYKSYYKDITLPVFKRMNYFVVKVIIPRMQPLYLNEKYPLLGGERLYSVPERLGFKRKTESGLNKIPHPFL